MAKREFYDKGDIVFVEEFEYISGEKGINHYFVIIDVDGDDVEIVPLAYLGMLISSKTEKNKDVNAKFPYNEPIEPSIDTGLTRQGHVKTDEILTIKAKHIAKKIGSVTIEQYETYLKMFLKAKSE